MANWQLVGHCVSLILHLRFLCQFSLMSSVRVGIPGHYIIFGDFCDGLVMSFIVYFVHFNCLLFDDLPADVSSIK